MEVNCEILCYNYSWFTHFVIGFACNVEDELLSIRQFCMSELARAWISQRMSE